ncbi:hypothetical protein [Chryseobacterium sp.]|uniref:hypothetical protein n=1 Tax=Chryseobacterium sp. TaxID=1871047 RepID=UPI0028A1EB7B|nr:hypothetical protein [Chryseobacterium sp.]
MNFKINSCFLLLFAMSFFFSQTITLVSEKTNLPLPKVSVFDKDGKILAHSDIDGKIDRSVLNQNHENFKLVYENMALAELSFSELNKDVVKLNDRVKEIAPVIIKKTKPAKYVFIKGNFNAYVTVNNLLNCYVDGIATYVFDNKSKKVKDIHIQQYRIFRLENAKNEKKEMGSWDYNASLELPKLKGVGNTAVYQNKRTKIKELKGNLKDEIEITGEAFQEKELALFGYRFFDAKGIMNISYEKDSKKAFRDFLESNEITFLKVKHKSEANYNQMIVYKNFYPVELDFNDKDTVEEVKYNRNQSNYSSKYWVDSSFPNMQTIFSSFFKDDLKEKQNIK